MGNNAWRWGLILSAGKVAIGPRRKSAGTEMYKMEALVLPHMLHSLHSAHLAFLKRGKKGERRNRQEWAWVSGGTRRHTLECEMDSVAQSAFHKAFFPAAP